jgi:hypothetical protein
MAGMTDPSSQNDTPPRFVLGALQVVRASGPSRTDMADFDTICRVAEFLGYVRAAAWLRANPARYVDALSALEQAIANRQLLPLGYWTNGRESWSGPEIETGVVPADAWWVEPHDE